MGRRIFQAILNGGLENKVEIWGNELIDEIITVLGYPENKDKQWKNYSLEDIKANRSVLLHGENTLSIASYAL